MTNTNTDTPHLPPPPPAPDGGVLNRQIAQLLGWKWYRYTGKIASPDPDGREYAYFMPDHIVHDGDTVEVIEGELDASLIRVWEQPRCPVPDYAGDPAAAFELLDHALTIRQVFKHEISKGLPDGPHRYCRIYTAFGTFVGCADTLPIAIALSCRDALAAIKGDTDNGTA